MKCKNETCSNEAAGSSAYCSESCRTIYNRNKRNTTGGTIATGTAGTATTGTLGFCKLPGTVYNRPAVSYVVDQHDSRPMPLNPDDHPHPGGRGKYTRQDGSVYQFDCNGASFEVTAGKVYQATKAVQECYA
jgi:hypothetical protein